MNTKSKEKIGEYITLHREELTRLIAEELSFNFLKGLTWGIIIGLASPLLITYIWNLF